MDNVVETVGVTNYKLYLKKNLSKHILIYGAGIVAYYFAYELMKDGEFWKDFVGFAVKNPQNDVSNYWGMPVKGIAEYEECKEEYCLIVATKENVWNEITYYLKKECNWKDVYFLSTNEYMQIKAKYSQLMEEEYFVRQFEKIRVNFGRLEGSLYHVGRMISSSEDKYKYHSNLVEETRYLEEFRKFRCKGNYTQEVQELLDGLPIESIQEVSRILDRLNRLCDNRPILFSSEEQEKVKDVINEFTENIFKISDSWYMYKDYSLPVDHFEESVFWYEHGIGMLESLNTIKSGSLIDAGGFIGDSALVFSKYWKGKIYSFEADPDNYNYLKRTIRLNSLNNVVPMNLALIDRRGFINLYKTEAISCSTVEAGGTFAPLRGDFISIESISIDDFVEEHGLSVGLIKTDVEGAECRLLEGAKKTIKNQRPALIISIYHSIEDFFHIKRKIESMEVGYRFKVFRPVLRESILLETCLICEVPQEKGVG